jgi:hypothetical protein
MPPHAPPNPEGQGFPRISASVSDTSKLTFAPGATLSEVTEQPVIEFPPLGEGFPHAQWNSNADEYKRFTKK